MPTAKRLLPLTLALILVGCAAPSTKHRDAPLVNEATGRFRAGDFTGASQVYQRLAEQSNDADYYRLLAADAELRAGNDRAARTLLSVINTEELEEGDQQRYALIRSRIDLNQGKARDAMARLNAMNEQSLTAPLRANYHNLRASAYNQLGNMLECARERVYYGQLINNPEAVQKNNEGIYDALNRVPFAVLTGMQPSSGGTLGGWMALTIVLRGPESERTQALQAWRTSHPGHPANGPFVENFLKQKPKVVEITPLKTVEAAPAEAPATPTPVPATPQAATPSPTPAPSNGFIGVMLPLTGQYAVAAQAMRSGLTAAASADANPGKLELRFVDTQGGDIAGAYQKLAAEGAKFVIGPLTKEEVAGLGKLAELPVPVLALNQSPDLVPREGLYQFALTPEQELEQAASLAWFDGRQNALLLAPASAFGQRMINHFSTYWKSLGGKLASIKTYPPGAADYSETARQLLAGGAGGESGSAPSRPEFIFLIADSRDGKLLNPHIQNQDAGRIPIYATSQIFNGQPGAPQNNDLSGVTFCDSPWLLSSDNGPLSRLSLLAAAQQTPELYLRLLPMGLDAYRLLPELSQLKASPQYRFNGASGVLTMKAGNRIQRQLHCAQFEGPILQQRGIAPTLQPGSP
jgi:outer membrane PBP1 activator LpoA protein